MDYFSFLLEYRACIKKLIVDQGRRSNIKQENGSEVFLRDICQKNDDFLIPRFQKEQSKKKRNAKKNAEVFTPSWLCNFQNNLIDSQWFQKENVFNTSFEKTWITNKNKIAFGRGKKWQDYVSAPRLEICCGEGPYLVSRYDSISGKSIPIEDRIGILDRKLRIVSENTASKRDWVNFSKIAFKSTYGYEKDAHNLILARFNLFMTFVEYYCFLFSKQPREEDLIEISEIISWNVWQMDNLDSDSISSSKIMDWKKNQFFSFKDLLS